jgi:glycosyltransferase involved in cell wall biosynthesis
LQKIITHVNFAKGFRGGERQTQLLIEQLSLLDYKQKLIVRKNSELTKRCNGLKNLEIIEISKPYVLHLNKIKDSSIIHAHETKALQFAYFANLLKKIPFIVTRRVDNPLKTNFLNNLMYTNAKVSVALSKAIEKEILRVAPKAKTTIIPSAFSNIEVNEESAKEIKNKFDKKFLIGHVGALDDKHKGQSIIIDIAKKIEISRPEIHFLLVGGGCDEEHFKEMAKGLTNITFEGFVNNVNDYIKCFDMFVFPSRNEGLGSTLLDVMKIGIPIIASRVGGIPDIIKDGENGLLFDINNLGELEKLILALYGDREKADSLVSNALKSVEKYSAQNMAEAYIKIYEE